MDAARGWAREAQVAMRDAVVLLPFAQLLPLARREWAGHEGWMPRIETTRTLAASLAPALPGDERQISFDPALDRLRARRMLREQGALDAWARRDPRGFDQAAAALVQTAHLLARRAAAVAPAERDGFWQLARTTLATGAGPGGSERLLARLALEWAAAGAAPDTDALFELRPSAWIVIEAGGPDPLVDALLAHAAPHMPCLRLSVDVSLDDPFARLVDAPVRLAVCSGFEDEALHSAAAVLRHLQAGAQPVALIAQDRLLVRRVRALLARRGVALLDETGWKLSTTRAGAMVAALLKAASPLAASDDWLDWLKPCAPAWPQRAHAPRSLRALETVLRRHGWASPRRVDAARLGEGAAALWQAAAEVLAPLQTTASLPLARWLLSLREALTRCGARALLEADDAGRQLLTALHLSTGDTPGGDFAMTLADFTRWVDEALEEASFLPEAPPDAAVVITPLERAMLRPFAAVVFPGADAKRLGAGAPPPSLLGAAASAALGLPTHETRRAAETLAFAQVLALPRVTLLRRSDDAGEPLAASPLLERLALVRERAGLGPIPPADERLTMRTLAPQPVQRPQPAVPHLPLERLSASACEALRACPYRFFALRVLGLRSADELDDDVEKRDYGSWLHAVLQRFHASREAPLPADAEEARLRAVGQAVAEEMQFDAAAFLPFSASFDRFVPRYVQWLHGRDADGASWLEGERELLASPPEWGGVQMHGVIDRVDSVPGDDGPVIQLIDYKTGSAAALRQLVKRPQEDTQLAFYAALMSRQSAAVGDIEAIYLPLDDSEGIRAIAHVGVDQTAERLVQGIGGELQRLREGAPMPALGEGSACMHCDARGLCRRDHWPATEEAP